jgi:hypothetical protein
MGPRTNPCGCVGKPPGLEVVGEGCAPRVGELALVYLSEQFGELPFGGLACPELCSSS